MSSFSIMTGKGQGLDSPRSIHSLVLLSFQVERNLRKKLSPPPKQQSKDPQLLFCRFQAIHFKGNFPEAPGYQLKALRPHTSIRKELSYSTFQFSFIPLFHNSIRLDKKMVIKNNVIPINCRNFDTSNYPAGDEPPHAGYAGKII